MHYPQLLDKNIYKNYVKDRCVNDDSPLSGDCGYYEQYGNFCKECVKEANRIAQERMDALRKLKKEAKEELKKINI